MSADDRPLYQAWREGGASEILAYTATQKVRDMAGANVDTFLGAKIETQVAEVEAQGAELRAEIETQRKVLATHTASLRWMMGILLAVFASLVVLLTQALLQPPAPGRATAVMQQSVEPTSGDHAAEQAGSSVTEEDRSVAPYIP